MPDCECPTEAVDRRHRIRMATTRVIAGWWIVFSFSAVLVLMLGTESDPAAPLAEGVVDGAVILLCAALGLYLMITGLAERKRLGASNRELW